MHVPCYLLPPLAHQLLRSGDADEASLQHVSLIEQHMLKAILSILQLLNCIFELYIIFLQYIIQGFSLDHITHRIDGANGTQGSDIPGFPSSRETGQRSREDQTFLRKKIFYDTSKSQKEVSQPLIQRQLWGR